MQTDGTTRGDTVALVMCTARKSPRSIETAVSLAAERGSRLVVVFALDEEGLNSVVEKLGSEGWIGERPSEDFHEAAITQRRELGEGKLTEVQTAAREVGVTVETRIAGGTFEQTVRDIVRSENPETVVLTRRKRSEISRFILGSPVKKLQEELSTEVILVDEE